MGAQVHEQHRSCAKPCSLSVPLQQIESAEQELLRMCWPVSDRLNSTEVESLQPSKRGVKCGSLDMFRNYDSLEELILRDPQDGNCVSSPYHRDQNAMWKDEDNMRASTIRWRRYASGAF